MGVTWMVNTVVLVFTLIAGLVVFLRLITRGALMRNAGFEDVWSTFAMVCSVGLSVTFALQIKNGMGMHIYELTDEMMINSQKAFWASLLFYYLALTSTKMSILVQYLRIFPNAQFRRITLIAIGVIVVWGLWTLMASIFICFPVSFFWDKNIDGKCLNQELVWFTNAGINITQDILILIMPIPVLRSLSIPDKQKRALIIVFLCGGLVCIVSIVRLKSLVAISNSKDPTFDNLPAAVLSAIEINVGIVCACLPSMRPLLTAMMPTYFPDGKSRYSQNRGTHDEEHVKNFKYPSSSDVTYPVRAASRGGYSRGSNKIIEPNTPGHDSKMSQGTAYSSRSNSRSGSRAGSRNDNVYRQTPGTYHARTTSNQTQQHIRSSSRNSSRSPSRNAGTPTQLENLYRGPPSAGFSPAYSRPASRTRNNSVPQDAQSPTYISHATLTHPSYGINGPAAVSRQRSHSHSHSSVHQQHHLHPLRLSPYNPSIKSNTETVVTSPEPTHARLPQLPEHMATFDPFQTQQRTMTGPLGPPHTPRRLVFHKPLPITPFPVSVAEKEKEAESVKTMDDEDCEQCKTGICTLHLVVQH